MRDDVVGKLSPQLRLELYQPVFTCACLHGGIVLPVNVHAVYIIPEDESGKAIGSGNWVLACRGGELGGPKG